MCALKKLNLHLISNRNRGRWQLRKGREEGSIRIQTAYANISKKELAMFGGAGKENLKMSSHLTCLIQLWRVAEFWDELCYGLKEKLNLCNWTLSYKTIELFYTLPFRGRHADTKNFYTCTTLFHQIRHQFMCTREHRIEILGCFSKIIIVLLDWGNKMTEQVLKHLGISQF